MFTRETFPDIESAQIVENITFDELNKFPHYIAEVDISINCKSNFVPIAVRNYSDQAYAGGFEGSNGCKYLNGNFKNQVYNDQDIRESMRFGC